LRLLLARPLAAWDRVLTGELASETQALQLFVAFVESQAGIPFLVRSAGPSSKSAPLTAPPLVRASAPADRGSIPFLVDSNRSASILLPTFRLPVALDSRLPARRSSARPSDAGQRQPSPRPMSILPLANFTLVSSPGDAPSSGCRPASLAFHLFLARATPTAAALPTNDFEALRRELAEGFHALALLTHHRWQTDVNDPTGRLPLHLAAVARMAQSHGALQALLS